MLESAVQEIHRRWAEEAEARHALWRRRANYVRLDRLVPVLEDYCLDEAAELPRDVRQEVLAAVQASDEHLGRKAAGLRAPSKLLDCVFDAQEVELRKLGAGPFEDEIDEDEAS